MVGSQDQNQSSSGGENVEVEAKNVSRANLKQLAQVTRSIVVLGSKTRGGLEGRQGLGEGGHELCFGCVYMRQLLDVQV